LESHPRLGDLVIVVIDGAATCVDTAAVVESFFLRDTRQINGEVPGDQLGHGRGDGQEQTEPDPLGDDPMPVMRTVKTDGASDDPVLSHTDPGTLEEGAEVLTPVSYN
jgi:hypothetical protein